MSTSGGRSRMSSKSIKTQLEVAIIHEVPRSIAKDSCEESQEHDPGEGSSNCCLGSRLKKLYSQGSVDLFSAEFEECIGDNEAISVANSLAELRALELNGGPTTPQESMDSESWPAPPENLDQFPEEYIAEDSGFSDKQYSEATDRVATANGSNEIPTTFHASHGAGIIPDYSQDPAAGAQTLLRRPHQYENIEFIDDETNQIKRNTWPLQSSSNNESSARASGYENVDLIGKKQLSLIPEASTEDVDDLTPTNREDYPPIPGAKVERLSFPPPLVSRDRGEPIKQAARSRKLQYENFVLPEEQALSGGPYPDTEGGSRQIDVMRQRSLPPASTLRNQMQKQKALSIDSAQSDLSAEDVDISEDHRACGDDVFERELEDLSDQDSWFSDSDFDSEEDEAHSVSYDQESVYSGDGSISSDDSKEQTLSRSPAKRDPLFGIVFEFLKTEKAYVDKLHFICRVVLLNLKVLDSIPGVSSIRQESVQQIFSNVEAIYMFHSGNLLPKLEERVTTWNYNRRLGDLLRDMIPCLSLYIEYVENFKKSLSLLEQSRQKNQVFGALIEEVERTPECRRLSVKQHLLDIVHRVPKYQSLAKDYLEHLPSESDDRNDASEASHSLNMAAQELERAMGKDDRLKKLKEVQLRIEPSNNLLSQTREYITEGKIKTVSVKGINTIDRYIFLFNDVILLCGTGGLGGKHKVKKSIDMDGMQIHDGDNLVVPHTFYIQSRTKAIEFHASSGASKTKWVQAIRDARDDFMTWKLSEKPLTRQSAMQEDQLGKMAPKTLSRQSKSIFCRLCGTAFGSVSKRNECKACGQIFCARCCTQKARLAYDSNRLNRVCDECYIIIRNRDLADSEWETPESSAGEVSWRMSGAMQFTGDGGSHWKKRWFTLRSDGFLLCYRKKGDKEYLTSLPLKRFAVGSTIKTDPVFKTYAFKLHNLRKTYFFQASDVSVADRWIQNMADYTDSAA